MDETERSDQDAEQLDQDIFDLPVDAGAVTAVVQSLELPTGTYYSAPPLTVAASRVPATGRPILRAYGLYTSNEGRTGRIGFMLSPQVVKQANRRTGEIEFDRASKNYALVVRAYRQARGESPGSLGDLASYLGETSIGVRLVQFTTDEGDVRTAVVNIFPVREA